MNDMAKRIGILTAGGDCPGINATIRGVCKTAIHQYGIEVIGFHDGFQGAITGDYEEMTDNSLTGLLYMGGTVLGTSRAKPFKQFPADTFNKADAMVANFEKLGLDAIVCIGGNGTQKTAYKMVQRGINVVSIPKTIDNDVWGTDQTFGFDTAVSIATEAIDRLHSTASSHKRVMVIEVMGHKAGWISLYSGMAGGGDIILLPELEYQIDSICNAVYSRIHKGKAYSIVVVAEGLPTDGQSNAGEYIARKIRETMGLETRETVLGYVQRGGAPTSFDRNLATRMGGYATDLIVREDYGRMVALQGTLITSVPLEEVGGKTRMVPSDHDLIVEGRKMGICFG